MLRGLQTPQMYVGSTIIFTPHTAQAQHTFTYWYMPSCQLLTMDLPTARCQDHGPADASLAEAQLQGVCSAAAHGRAKVFLCFHRRSIGQRRRPIVVRRRLPELRCGASGGPTPQAAPPRPLSTAVRIRLAA